MDSANPNPFMLETRMAEAHPSLPLPDPLDPIPDIPGLPDIDIDDIPGVPDLPDPGDLGNEIVDLIPGSEYLNPGNWLDEATQWVAVKCQEIALQSLEDTIKLLQEMPQLNLYNDWFRTNAGVHLAIALSIFPLAIIVYLFRILQKRHGTIKEALRYTIVTLAGLRIVLEVYYQLQLAQQEFIQWIVSTTGDPGELSSFISTDELPEVALVFAFAMLCMSFFMLAILGMAVVFVFGGIPALILFYPALAARMFNKWFYRFFKINVMIIMLSVTGIAAMIFVLGAGMSMYAAIPETFPVYAKLMLIPTIGFVAILSVFVIWQLDKWVISKASGGELTSRVIGTLETQPKKATRRTAVVEGTAQSVRSNVDSTNRRSDVRDARAINSDQPTQTAGKGRQGIATGLAAGGQALAKSGHPALASVGLGLSIVSARSSERSNQRAHQKARESFPPPPSPPTPSSRE